MICYEKRGSGEKFSLVCKSLEDSVYAWESKTHGRSNVGASGSTVAYYGCPKAQCCTLFGEALRMHTFVFILCAGLGLILISLIALFLVQDASNDQAPAAKPALRRSGGPLGGGLVLAGIASCAAGALHEEAPRLVKRRPREPHQRASDHFPTVPIESLRASCPSSSPTSSASKATLSGRLRSAQTRRPPPTRCPPRRRCPRRGPLLHNPRRRRRLRRRPALAGLRRHRRPSLRHSRPTRRRPGQRRRRPRRRL
mmetsp:Transcript_23812/g.84997  ORF Transcript_23812/g.84997 Transcript_23812/m.84997 type:complete len:254 (+) Transcript_23812:864-1625(+)